MDTSKYVAEFQQLEKDLSSGNLSAADLAAKAKRHAYLKPIIEKEREVAAVEKSIADDVNIIAAAKTAAAPKSRASHKSGSWVSPVFGDEELVPLC